MSTGLRTRPSATAFPLDDLVSMALEGRIRVPSFQRGLRWTRADVVTLFDSVRNGYPIGSLLLWERLAPAEAVTLGPLGIDAAAGTAHYVVDGQQRITALAAALTAEGQVDQRYQVGYDLAAHRFVARPAREGPTYVPAHVLFDLSGLLVWFRDRPELAESFDEAAEVSKALRDLKIPAYVVNQDDEEVLRSIFDRMNNAGKKLTRAEVFGALHHGSGDGGSPLRGVVEALQARTGFGVGDEGLAMQAVLARRGPDVTREIRNEFNPAATGRDEFAASEPEQQAYAKASDALVRTVEFLQNDAGVPHVALLPYQYLLITLVRFFAHHPQPTPRSRRLLRRWFWRAAVAGPIISRGNSTGASRSLNRAVDISDEAAATMNLIRSVGSAPRPPYPHVNPFRTNSAATKTLLCAMWSAGPRGLTTGDVAEPAGLRRWLDEYPASDLALPLAAKAHAQGTYPDAGNRILLLDPDDRDSDVLPILVNLPDSSVSDAVLASHQLTREDVGELVGPAASQAIERRNERLTDLLITFLDRMCESEQEDSPDLELLVGGADAPA